jgi:hypothetical protein
MGAFAPRNELLEVINFGGDQYKIYEWGTIRGVSADCEVIIDLDGRQ